MIAFKDLKDILKITLKWERKLKDFYDVAEIALSNEESRHAVALLRSKLLEKLEILEGIDLNNYGKTEWVRYAPDYKSDELIPVGIIQRNSTPEEIFSHLLGYDQKLKGIYASISANLISRTQKELFESLADFKNEQIEEITGIMENFRER